MKSVPLDRLEVMVTQLGAKPGKCSEFEQALKGLVLEIRKQPGCMDSVAARDISKEDRFLIYSTWQGEGSLRTHLASEDFRILLGATNLLCQSVTFEFAATNPGVHIQALAAAQGGPAAHRTPALDADTQE